MLLNILGMASRKKNENPKQGKWSIDSMKKAVEAVKIKKKLSIHRAAKQVYVPKTTQERRVNGKRQVDDPASKLTVFSADHENQRFGHILEMPNCGFGMTIVDTCRTVYVMAKMLKINHRFSKTKARAGYDVIRALCVDIHNLQLENPGDFQQHGV